MVIMMMMSVCTVPVLLLLMLSVCLFVLFNFVFNGMVLRLIVRIQTHRTEEKVGNRSVHRAK